MQFLYGTLIILNLLPIFFSVSCSSYNNCFTCNSISNYICKWDQNKCIDNQSSSSETLYQRLLNCYDNSNTLYFIQQYCGNTNLILIDDDIKIKLPENNKLYGFENLYCRYTIFNSKGKSNKFYVKIKQNIYLSPSFKLMISEKNDNSNNNYDNSRIINKKKTTFEIKDSIEIYIDYYSTTSYSENPIEITITLKQNLSIIIILLICLILSIVFFILFIVILFINKNCFNRNSNQNKKKKIEERKIAENLFQKIKFILFNDYKEKEKVNACSICLENFNPEDKIIINKCNHIFHLECLKKWFIPLNSIEVNNTCPGCRNELFDLKNIKNNNLDESNNILNINNNCQPVQNNDNNSTNNNNNNNTNNNNANTNNNNIIPVMAQNLITLYNESSRQIE